MYTCTYKSSYIQYCVPYFGRSTGIVCIIHVHQCRIKQSMGPGQT